MFGYRSNVPKVRLTTDRWSCVWCMIVMPGVLRIITQKSPFPQALGASARRKPLLSIGWQARLGMINEFHKQGSAFYLAYSTRTKKRLLALPIFPMCSWLFSCLLSRLFDWAKMAGKGLMFEALTAAIRYMQRTQQFIALWLIICRTINAAVIYWPTGF